MNAPNVLLDCRHGRMLCLASDQVITRALELYGEFAESENKVMTQILKPGQVAIDIGANIGTVTLPLARHVGERGRVLAFEPQRIVFQYLCANVALNGLTNVETIWAALGAAVGATRIQSPAPGESVNFGAARTGEEGARVPMLRLDDLQLARCDLIKVDVEGMEYEVLSGAAQTVARLRPAVYFEAKSGEGTRKCLNWFFERDYRLFWHFAPFYEAKNWRQHADNVFPARGDINALALPGESTLTALLPAVSGADADWRADYDAWTAANENLKKA